MSNIKKSKKKVFAVAILFLFLLTAGGGYYAYHQLFSGLDMAPKQEGKNTKTEKKPEEKFFKEAVNIIVVGTDERGNEKSRTDTIMVYRLDPIKNEVRLFSIPRDTYVNIPGRGMDKINHAHAFGGIDLTIKTVEEFLGIKIDHYVRTNFEGFKELIDLVGGVNIDVEKNIKRGDISISKGQRRLNSEEALVYVRDRYDPMGDIQRVKRQQKFIKALVKEVNNYEPKWKLATVIPDVYSNVKTDIPLKAGKEILSMVSSVDMEKSEIDTVPGWFYNKNGISYWKPNLDETAVIVSKIFKEEVEVSSEEKNGTN